MRFYEIENGEKEIDTNALNFHILLAKKIHNNNYRFVFHIKKCQHQ